MTAIKLAGAIPQQSVPEDERIFWDDVQTPSKGVIQTPGPRVLKIPEMSLHLVEVIDQLLSHLLGQLTD